MISWTRYIFLFSAVMVAYPFTSVSQTKASVLKPIQLKNYVNYFNSLDKEDVKNFVTNAQAFDWLTNNIPLFECPDSILQQTYYYRWWTFRKHLKQTPDGFIFTEFITPVSHASQHNAISCALGHHIYEGRWLHNQQYLDQYISFWLFHEQNLPKSKFHSFSNWLSDAVYNRYLVHPDKAFLQKVLPSLDSDYKKWEEERQLPDGMFWQHDVKDGMEESISGGRRVKNVRPTINSYMYGNAVALSKIGKLLNDDSIAVKYNYKAAKMKLFVQSMLWNDSASFFEVLNEQRKFTHVREAIGFIPWYFNLPDDVAMYAEAWDQLLDTAGFNAPWGQTTAERRHPQFRSHGVGTCEWDGAVWPFATSQTMKGLSNLLTNYKQQGRMTSSVFYNELHKYAWSHQKNGQPYIGEYQDERTGYWLKGDHPRSSFYNHSTFCDIVISDLVGLKPRADNVIEVHPLVPANQWDWFCLDNVKYHNTILTIVWDKNGKKYKKGKGFMIYADGKVIHKSKTLQRVETKLK